MEQFSALTMYTDLITSKSCHFKNILSDRGEGRKNLLNIHLRVCRREAILVTLNHVYMAASARISCAAFAESMIVGNTGNAPDTIGKAEASTTTEFRVQNRHGVVIGPNSASRASVV
jgi:hypothetical protein